MRRENIPIREERDLKALSERGICSPEGDENPRQGNTVTDETRRLERHRPRYLQVLGEL